MLTIGCHLSTTKGYRAMGETALSIGANTFAFFTRNPRGGKAKDLDMDDVAALRELMAQNDFGPLVAHAPYTYNPCSAKERAREFALEAMAEDFAASGSTARQLLQLPSRCACGTGGRRRHSDDCRHAVPGDVWGPADDGIARDHGG